MANIHRAIGIDLGTTNSVVAWMRAGEPKVIPNALNELLTPSAVGLGRNGELIVGKAAKNKMGDRNTVLSIKRFMGLPFDLTDEDRRRVHYEVSEGPGREVRIHFNNRAYSPTDLSAIILHKLRQDAQDRLGEPVGRAVITVPAYFNDAQVAATRDAGRMAGFTVMRIIREPTAAALAFGLDRSLDLDANADTASVLVYDLGGGTFDISILMMVQGIFQVMGIEGDKHLGGDDFDYEIMKRLYQLAGLSGDLSADRQAQARLKLKAEDAKKELSSVTATEITVPSLAGRDLEDELTRDELNLMIQPWIDRTIELMRTAMRDSKLTAELIDHILLVGGSTLIPLVQEALRREFGEKKIMKNIDPMLCVALGAAIQTTMLDQIDCPNPDCRDGAGQPTKNPLDAAECAKCHTSLIGFDTVLCPECFVPGDAGQTTCRHCQTAMTVPDVPKASASQFWKCADADCGYPKNPPALNKCEMCDKPREGGGAKCANCGHLNPPGRSECVKCHTPMGDVVAEATPEDLGVELHEGRMSVIVPKNTPYSPKTGLPPKSKDYYTVEANQRRVDIVVWEGPDEMAARNEYCGVVMLELPPDLPKGTTVMVSLGLDGNGIISTAVQLRDYPGRRTTARMARGGQPQARRRRDELIKTAREALKDGGGSAEEARFAKRIDDLEGANREVSEAELEKMEQELSELQARRDAERAFQSTLSEADFTLRMASDYLSPENRTEIERRSSTVRKLLARGQKEQAADEARALQKYLDERPVLWLVAMLEAVRQGGKVTAVLSNRIGAGLRALRAARGDAEQQRCLDELVAAWEEVNRELGDKAPSKKKGVATRP